MSSSVPTLVRTPPQFHVESPLGYILRLSVANGYDTPRYIFQLARLARHETFTIGLNARKIAQICGPMSAPIRGYCANQDTDPSHVMLCGHELLPHDLDIVFPKVCPDCVLADGYISAWVDLRLVDACPIHKRMLLRACPICGRRLSWYRAGLLQCNCGATLGPIEGRIGIGDEHAAILRQIVAKVTGTQAKNDFGMPVSHFTATTLRGLIGLSIGMASIDRAANISGYLSDASSAAAMFSDWPSNLHQAIRKLIPVDKVRNGAVRLRRHLEGKYRLVLKEISGAKDIAFVREAIGEMAQSLEPHSIVQTEDEYARGHSEEPHSIEKKDAPNRPRKKTSKLHPRKCRNASTLSARESAKILGIPVSVLKALRKSGHFEARKRASRAVSFHADDIASFELKIHAIQQLAPRDPWSDGISLKQAMHLKFKFEDGKGQLVAAVLDGRIEVIGTTNTGVCGLVVRRSEVNEFLVRTRSEAFGNTFTPSEVGRLLGCDPLIVPVMLANGYLHGYRNEMGLRITEESAYSFGSKYCSLALLARKHATSSRHLMSTAIAAGIQVLAIPRSNGKGSQPFISTAEIENFGGK